MAGEVEAVVEDEEGEEAEDGEVDAAVPREEVLLRVRGIVRALPNPVILVATEMTPW